MLIDSIAEWPDLRKGRGIGWGMPFSSIVRERSVYSPAARPGRRMAQWALARRIGQVRGRPEASKPRVSEGISSSGRLPPQRGGGPRIWASSHGAVRKFLSSAGHSWSLGVIQTWTFDKPEMPTWAWPVMGIGCPTVNSVGAESVAANDFSGLSTSLLPLAYVSLACDRFVRTTCESHLIDLKPYPSGTTTRTGPPRGLSSHWPLSL